MLNNLQNWWQNFNENYKRIILLILFSATVVFLAFLIYYVFFRPRPVGVERRIPREVAPTLPSADIRKLLEKRGIKPEEEKKEAPVLPAAGLKPVDKIAKGGPTLAVPVVYSGVANADINTNGAIRYYDKIDGKFYSRDKNGNIIPLSDQSFPNVEKTIWSPQGNKAILEYPDGNNVFYDFDEKRQYTLPKEAEGFDFSSAGAKISYKFLTENPDENWLVTSDPNGQNAKAIELIGRTNPADVNVNWSPDSSKVAIFNQSADLEQEQIIFIGQNQENFKSLKVNGRGFRAIWSPQSDKLIYNVYNSATDYRPSLYFTNARDNNMGVKNQELGLWTWAEKCTFADDNITVYCAVPLYLKTGSGIYPQLAQNTPDTIYKINTNSGFKQEIAQPTDSLGIGLYTAQKLMLSTDESILYMVGTNGGLFEIRLK